MPGMLAQIVRDQQKQVERIASTTENLQRIVREAIASRVPVMPLKNSPETGLITIGLPVPENLRERLLKQKERLKLRSYKAAVFVAIRVGLDVMERTVADEIYSPGNEKSGNVTAINPSRRRWHGRKACKG